MEMEKIIVEIVVIYPNAAESKNRNLKWETKRIKKTNLKRRSSKRTQYSSM